MKEHDWRFYRLSLFFFLLLWLPVLIAIIRDLRPEPVYQDIKTDGTAHYEMPGFESGEPIEIEFEAPKKDINGVYWHQLITLPFHEAAITIENLTKGTEPISLGSPNLEGGTDFDVREFNDRGDRIRLSIRWDRETPPQLMLTAEEPARPLALMVNGEPIAKKPILFLGPKNPKKRSEPDPAMRLFPTKTEGEPFPLTSGVSVSIQTEAPSDNTEFLILPDLLSGEEKATVEVTIQNETTGEMLKSFRTRSGKDFTRVLPKEKITAGDQIAINLLWNESPPPRIQQAIEPPLIDLSVKDGDAATNVRPIFLVRYEWPTRSLFWIWLAVPIVLIATLKSDRRSIEAAFLAVLVVAAFVTSALVWQQNYSHQHMHMDPDRYGAYGVKMADWLANPETRLSNELWIKNFPHAHVALTPLLVGIGTLLGFSKATAYLFLVGVATAATLCLFHFHLRRQLDLSKSLVVFGCLLFGCHLFFLKAAGRPSTDALGLTLVLAVFVTLMARFRDGGWKNGLLLTLLLILGALARPPGLAYFFPIIALALMIDWCREGQLRFLRRIRTGFEIALPAVLFLAVLYISFDWFHSQRLAMKKSEEFHEYSTLPLFLRCLVPFLGLMPLAWLWLRKLSKREGIAVSVYAMWALFYLVFLWLVKAPFLTRLFLPALPAVVLLAILALSKMKPRMQTVSFAVILIGSLVCVGIMYYLIGLPFLPPSNISPFIY